MNWNYFICLACCVYSNPFRVWTIYNDSRRAHVAFVRLHWWQLTESLRGTNNGLSSPLWLPTCRYVCMSSTPEPNPIMPHFIVPAAATCCPRWRHCTTEASETAWRICSTACCMTADWPASGCFWVWGRLETICFANVSHVACVRRAFDGFSEAGLDAAISQQQHYLFRFICSRWAYLYFLCPNAQGW